MHYKTNKKMRIIFFIIGIIFISWLIYQYIITDSLFLLFWIVVLLLSCCKKVLKNHTIYQKNEKMKKEEQIYLTKARNTIFFAILFLIMSIIAIPIILYLNFFSKNWTGIGLFMVLTLIFFDFTAVFRILELQGYNRKGRIFLNLLKVFGFFINSLPFFIVFCILQKLFVIFVK